MEKSESNRKRRRVDIDQCQDNFKENFQPGCEIQFPGILTENTRTSDGVSGHDTQTRVILFRSEEKTHNPGQTEEDFEYTGSSQHTKKRKQKGPFLTVMADHVETSRAAQSSGILKPFVRGENPGPTNHRTGQTKPYKCLICSKLCTQKNHLTNHMKSHDKKGTQKANIITVVGVPSDKNVVESYRCLICFRSFARLSYLNTHTKMTHDKNSLASDKSQISVSIKRKFKLPGSTVTREKSYKCAFCEKSFGLSADRNRHLLTHLGEKPYGCHICGKSFVQKSNLNKHLKIHMRVMPQSQNPDANGQQTGGERFAGIKSKLSQNMGVNGQDIGEKRYKCALCSKSFRLSEYLRVHVRIHTGERPYKCQRCSKAFTQSHVLKSHLKTHSKH